jgi:hypothetical protein
MNGSSTSVKPVPSAPEYRKVALHDETGNHGKSEHGDGGQHHAEAEQTTGTRREHEDQGSDGAQAVTDR